ncbi:MAG: fibronectin type III domain-containing protein, partial [Actinomycetes bacterium]
MSTVANEDRIRRNQGVSRYGILGVLVVILAAALTGLASSPASAISRSDIITRAQSWVDASVPYSQDNRSPYVNQFGSYRRDCSGFVSMAWGLDSSLTTWSLPNVSHEISKDELQPGDALLNTYSHVALFVGWANDAHTSYEVYEENGAYMVAMSDTIAYPYRGLSGYVPYRYNNVEDVAPTPAWSYAFVAQTAIGTRGNPIDLSHAWGQEKASLQITVQNTGTETWNSNVRLGAFGGHLDDPGWFAPGRPAAVQGTVPPGGTYTFSFPITVGLSGTPSYTDSFNLVAENVVWFPEVGLSATVTFNTTVDFGVALQHHGSGGYRMAPDGIITPFGGAPDLGGIGSWPNWDIARDIVLRSDDKGGYVLDGYGGIHPFGNAPAITKYGYWGWDIARSIVLRPDGVSGYVLDGYGGVHAFGGAPDIADSSHAYWPSWDIARSIALRPDGNSGYVLEGFGGIHPFGNAPDITGPTPYWSGWDIARDIVLRNDGASGYVLDGYGGINAFGGALGIDNGSHDYWGWDIARGFAITSNCSSGVVVDGQGNTHAFATGSVCNPVTVPVAPAAPTGVAGNNQVALTWTAPGTGGSAITDYVVQYSTNGTTWSTFTHPVSTTTSATVTGLTNTTGYVFKVAAVNAVGTSTFSPASTTVTPLAPATVPVAPAAPTGVAGNNQVAL